MAESWPSTSTEFQNRFDQLLLLQNLTEEQKHASGSSWSTEHLQAFRVLVTDHHHLSILKEFKPGADRQLLAKGSQSTLLTRFSRPELETRSHESLREIGGEFGAFFVSLAKLAQVPRANVTSPPRTRSNQTPEENPSSEPGTETPSLTGSSISQFASSFSTDHDDEYLDYDEHK